MIRFFFHWLYTGTNAHESIKGYQNEKCMYFKYENESKKNPCNPLADPICTCMAYNDICMHFLDTTNSAWSAYMKWFRNEVYMHICGW